MTEQVWLALIALLGTLGTAYLGRGIHQVHKAVNSQMDKTIKMMQDEINQLRKRIDDLLAAAEAIRKAKRTRKPKPTGGDEVQCTELPSSSA